MSKKPKLQVITLMLSPYLGDSLARYLSIWLSEHDVAVEDILGPDQFENAKSAVSQAQQQGKDVLVIAEIIPSNVYADHARVLDTFAANLFDAQVPVARYSLSASSYSYSRNIEPTLKRTWVFDLQAMNEDFSLEVVANDILEWHRKQ